MVFIQRKCLAEFYSIALFWEVLKYHRGTFLVATIRMDDKGDDKEASEKGKEKKKKGDEEDNDDHEGRRKEKVVGYLFSITETCKSFDFAGGEKKKEKLVGEEGMDFLFEPVGNLYSLAVLPAFRGRGIGKKLLEESIRLLGDEGPCSTLWLNVRVSNAQAIRLYERVGFTM